MNLLSFRIPTLLGLAVLILGTIAGVYLVLQNQTITTKASPQQSPRNIVISNIEASSVTITWQTSTKLPGYVIFGQNSLEKTVLDDRDNGQLTPRATHHVTLKNLSPQTVYKFKIVSGRVSSQQLNFTTASSDQTQNGLKPVIGSVLDGDKPLGDGVAYLRIPGVVPQSALVKNFGNFIIPVNLARTEDLSTVFSPIDNMEAKLTVVGKDGRVAESTFILTKPEVGLLRMEQNLDLTIPSSLGISTSKFDLNGDGLVNSSDYAIILKNFGKSPQNKKADLNSDGVVDQKDVELILKEIKK